MKSSKKWTICFMMGVLLVLVVIGAFMVVVDPCFHYHKPLSTIGYSLENERYQNDGIVKTFDYDAIITGSSMTECFRTSQMDEIFGVTSIKVPFSGGSFKEVNNILRVATEHNTDIKAVVRCLDAMRFFDDKDYLDYSDYPTYLYDENLLNDVNYIFNIELLLMAVQNVLGFNRDGAIELSFDEYVNWDEDHTYGLNAILSHYNWQAFPVQEQSQMTEEEQNRLKENIEQNVVALAKEHPEIDFYFYISPSSIYCMDYWWRNGELEKMLQAERMVIELLLPYDNVHINSFNTEYEILSNADNFRDPVHHREEINTQILHWLAEGKHELEDHNYEEYCREVWDYYTTYDYDSLYK